MTVLLKEVCWHRHPAHWHPQTWACNLHPLKQKTAWPSEATSPIQLKMLSRMGMDIGCWWPRCPMDTSTLGPLGSQSWLDVLWGGCVYCILTMWAYELPWSSWEAVNSHQPHRLPFVDKPSSLLQHLFWERGEQCVFHWCVVSLHLKRLLNLGWKVNFKSTKMLLIIKLRIWGRWELMWELTIILIGVITTYRFLMDRK